MTLDLRHYDRLEQFSRPRGWGSEHGDQGVGHDVRLRQHAM
jgi:hypothetical protein